MVLSNADILRQYFGVTTDPPGANTPNCIMNNGIYGQNVIVNSAFGKKMKYIKYENFLPPPNQKFYMNPYSMETPSLKIRSFKKTNRKRSTKTKNIKKPHRQIKRKRLSKRK